MTTTTKLINFVKLFLLMLIVLVNIYVFVFQEKSSDSNGYKERAILTSVVSSISKELGAKMAPEGLKASWQVYKTYVNANISVPLQPNIIESTITPTLLAQGWKEYRDICNHSKSMCIEFCKFGSRLILDCKTDTGVANSSSCYIGASWSKGNSCR